MQVELRSRLIESASYDEESGLLRLYMMNGQLREFDRVPKRVFEELAAASSAGSYYVRSIRGLFPSPE